ncbi:uncharacterized protein AMSG_11154 [Thecamonas trahens ATCC 50062]|uniref:Cytoplasmic tRNA 2-thiolation protein 2 n=1 Tax=Thecamonas trahens ATCC 50062 TaxID=461836 RepID=A0A0L0DUM4_THETB|nr:hypothetical protein AMSG_11154 [Thecamonas trahens ATCC 50062]KNC55756.1 hypothetical protein AMSG_11154 [Thecamonas trahens ATCC 50062]|eukprot:XP_013752908.1 hypothetical protein AMSG_11154 [Thecamonas trahens ATCC 50062]
MCEANPEDDGAHEAVGRPKDRVCAKCGGEDEEVLVALRNRVLCGSCVERTLSARTRRTLFRSQLTRSGLLASGTTVALAFLANEAAEYAKIKWRVQGVFIDTSPHLKALASDDDRAAAAAAVMAAADAQSLSLDVTTISAELWPHLPSAEGVARVASMLAAEKTLSAREELLHLLRHRALVAYARRVGADALICGTSATALAVDAFMMLVNGRGEQVPDAVNMEAVVPGEPNLWLLRPLLSNLHVEMRGVVRARSLLTAELPPFTRGPSIPAPSAKATLRQLTATFMAGLQDEFPATLNAIAKTVRKLDVPDEAAFDPRLCALCCGRIALPRIAGAPSSGPVPTGVHYGAIDELPHADDPAPLCYACRQFAAPSM